MHLAIEAPGRFGSRVVPVKLMGDEAEDRSAIQHAAAAPVDVVFDIPPPSVDARVPGTAAINVGMVRLIRSGLIDSAQREVATFGLDHANAAVQRRRPPEAR